MVEAERLTGPSLGEVTELYGAAKALVAADQRGLLASLTEPASAAGHAERTGGDAHATQLLLDVLVAQGLAERSGSDVYVGTRGLQEAVRFGERTGMTRLWDHLPAFLADGSPFVRMDGDAADRAKVYVHVARALATLFEGAATALAKRLPGADRILDVGAGSGVWSLAMAERSPQSKVTALDLPDVLAAFLERADAAGLGERVETVAGDFHEADLPAGAFERIVLANVLHLEPAQSAAALIRRVRPALAAGGELVVIDALAEGAGERDLSRTVYALHLAMRTSTGRCHPAGEVAEWCREAGLPEIEIVATDAPPRGFAALVARG
jgi:SAM-dependent methyltransferase